MTSKIKIAVVSPSGSFSGELLMRAHARAQELDFDIVYASEARLGALTFLNGSKEQRLLELKNVENIEADAIWCARGGCGALELWPLYEPHIFAGKQAPMIGYSDITIYHFMRFMRARRIGIHGPVFLDLATSNPLSVEALLLLICKRAEEIIYPNLVCLNQPKNQVTGEILPMNLASLQSIMASFDSSFLRGKILAIEDINEPPYKVFRMMQQLNNAGILASLRALIIGTFSDQRSYMIEQIMLPLARELGIPLFDWPVFGHEQPNWPLLFGATVTIKKIDNHIFALGYNEQHDHRPIQL